tara:strand:+ start:15033 stop:15992 length:960 start_codon:yes stop_codon:yes gene_type:complete
MIGANVARSAAPSVLDAASANLGEVFAVKPDMTPLLAGETIADAPYIYIVQCTEANSKFRFSSKIVGADVSKWAGQQRAAAAQQVTHVGNVGAGTLDILLNNSMEYVLSIVFTFDKVEGSERQLVRRFHYTSTATETVANIAAEFVALINADEKAKTLVVAASVNNGADYGLSITSLAQTYNVIDGYEQVTFKVTLDGGFDYNGTTPVTYTTDPTYGIGNYELVADLERAAIGMEGINNLMKFPVPSYPVYATSGDTYDMYSIIYNDVHASANLNKDIASPEMTILAIEDGGAGQQAALQNELNPWFNSCAGNFPAVVL